MDLAIDPNLDVEVDLDVEQKAGIQKLIWGRMVHVQVDVQV